MTATKNQSFQIRPATAEDVEAISHVHIDSWRTAYLEIISQAHLDNLNLDAHTARHTRLMAKPGYRYFVAESKTAGIIGFISGGPERSGDGRYTGELYAIYLLQDFHRRGIGTSLVREWARKMLDDGLPNAMVWVLSANVRALEFYKRIGARFHREDKVHIGGEHLPEQALVFDDLKILTDLQP
jgi:ribosomal protein S18 acetylase RimI-like enzyme